MFNTPVLNLGEWRTLDNTSGGNALHLPARHLVTHGVIVGITGSEKTGLVTVIAEEALRARVPTIIIDVKGGLPNLLLSLPNSDPASLRPWFRDSSNSQSTAVAAACAAERQAACAAAGITATDLLKGKILGLVVA